MLPVLPARLSYVLVGLLVTTVLFYASFRPPTSQEQNVLDLPEQGTFAPDPLPSPSRPAATTILEDPSLYRVQNETLGFQEVYMISLPARTDKRDAFAMQAAFSGISYTQMDGVDGKLVPEKALPHTMDQNANAIGCWRAHLDVIQRIVREKVSTALIFEDDADWDVSFKKQLVQFARGSRYILKTPAHKSPFSPYGDDWDLLWLGHCGTWVHPEDNRRFFVIPDDPTVEPPEYRKNVDVPDMSHWEQGPNGDNRTRIVFNSEGGVCTASYAISQQGARKALYHMSMEPYNSPIDWGFSNLCKDSAYNFTCVSVFPQIVGVSRPTSNTSKWSDIGYGEDRGVEPANAPHLVYSTRLNMGNLLAGKTVFDSQYPDVTPAQLDIKDIGKAVGHIEVLELEPEPKSEPEPEPEPEPPSE
ncbi:hypothetical protein A1O3_08611 [Capronia epimyces CBS 606.96]|uniref:Glycosyl transferase family 25 domain-containing protein n=1 Tax=Capronia epimyces CBS 606.96 TaxID=1182542 RepID=W9XP56_9EURO|nr:uncharacterized protein A1O3_08611 [Capronia epimyces CBS 606.96]EXJ79110.1 hypothetical protein A1O3_08611 [Capronia epimyces CBS 606.96]